MRKAARTETASAAAPESAGSAAAPISCAMARDASIHPPVRGSDELAAAIAPGERTPTNSPHSAAAARADVPGRRAGKHIGRGRQQSAAYEKGPACPFPARDEDIQRAADAEAESKESTPGGAAQFFAEELGGVGADPLVHDRLLPVAEKDGKDRKQVERLNGRAGGTSLCGGEKRAEGRRANTAAGRAARMNTAKFQLSVPNRESHSSRKRASATCAQAYTVCRKGRGDLPFRQGLGRIGEHDLEHAPAKAKITVAARIP